MLQNEVQNVSYIYSNTYFCPIKLSDIVPILNKTWL